VRIEFAPEAVDDLAAAIEYVQERNPRAAAAMATAVFEAIEKLAANEFEGPERELRITGERVRSWPVRPYRIYYRREADALVRERPLLRDSLTRYLRFAFAALEHRMGAVPLGARPPTDEERAIGLPDPTDLSASYQRPSPTRRSPP
jgi:plasmid stabilization system protein ParE